MIKTCENYIHHYSLNLSSKIQSSSDMDWNIERVKEKSFCLKHADSVCFKISSTYNDEDKTRLSNYGFITSTLIKLER